jgi:hypothetical protein
MDDLFDVHLSLRRSMSGLDYVPVWVIYCTHLRPTVCSGPGQGEAGVWWKRGGVQVAGGGGGKLAVHHTAIFATFWSKMFVVQTPPCVRYQPTVDVRYVHLRNMYEHKRHSKPCKHFEVENRFTGNIPRWRRHEHSNLWPQIHGAPFREKNVTITLRKNPRSYTARLEQLFFGIILT